MAKLPVFASIFVALIALVAASTHTTVVTTTTVVDEDTNPQQCRMEIQQMKMTHCMQYMQMRSPGREYEPSFLRSTMAVVNQEEHLMECCDELKSVRSDCRGDAVRHLIKEMKKRYEMEEEMMQMMKDKAHMLPTKCGLKGRTGV